MRQKSSFLAMVSHEMCNPVNGINGMLELLIDSSLNEKQKKYAELMLQLRYAADLD